MDEIIAALPIKRASLIFGCGECHNTNCVETYLHPDGHYGARCENCDTFMEMFACGSHEDAKALFEGEHGTLPAAEEMEQMHRLWKGERKAGL